MYPRNHDMDDLFRKAAAWYPLQTRNSDWEAVAGRLKAAGKPAARRGSLSIGKYFAWLLLAPAAFVFHNSFKDTGTASRSDKSSLVTIQTKQYTTGPAPAVRVSPQKPVAKPVDASPRETKDLAASLPHTISYHQQPGNREAIISNRSFLIGEQKIAARKTSAQVSTSNGFYLGAGAGIDFGTVKGQSFTNAGYNIGLVAGYRFNKHWSFESGVSWIQKRYFTRGEHFSMKKLESSMPGMEMMKVKGQLSLFEIPYKLKYDFLLKKQSNFFITAGGSSNLYIKENNEYITRQNGVQETHRAGYDDVHCAPICLVHLSAGYEHSFTNKSRLRLEPYIKFPLRKVGMGSVPLLSVGLNVSVSNVLGRQNR
jgi:hypothetical protein